MKTTQTSILDTEHLENLDFYGMLSQVRVSLIGLWGIGRALLFLVGVLVIDMVLHAELRGTAESIQAQHEQILTLQEQSDYLKLELEMLTSYQNVDHMAERLGLSTPKVAPVTISPPPVP